MGGLWFLHTKTAATQKVTCLNCDTALNISSIIQWSRFGKRSQAVIIMLTAGSYRRDIIKYLAPGADDYINNTPFGSSELVAGVQEYCTEPGWFALCLYHLPCLEVDWRWPFRKAANFGWKRSYFDTTEVAPYENSYLMLERFSLIPASWTRYGVPGIRVKDGIRMPLSIVYVLSWNLRWQTQSIWLRYVASSTNPKIRHHARIQGRVNLGGEGRIGQP